MKATVTTVSSPLARTTGQLGATRIGKVPAGADAAPVTVTAAPAPLWMTCTSADAP